MVKYLMRDQKINTKHWESRHAFPQITSICIVSDKPGGYGGKDIWMSELTTNGFSFSKSRTNNQH